MKLLLVLSALTLGLAPLEPTLANPQFVKDMDEIRVIYLNAVNSGHKSDLRKAIRHINKLVRKYPNQPLVIVYQGCILAERGRDVAARPLNRMRNAEEGLQLVDQGLHLLKQRDIDLFEDAEARLIAAFLFINLPDGVFHRLREGSHLVEGLLAEPKLNEMPKALQAGIYYAAASVADKYNDKEKQRHYLELTLKTAPEGRNAKKAKAILEKLSG